MPKLLYSLRGVPEDEIYEIKELLTENEINFYETSAGNWGISMPGLWLNNSDEFEKAQSLLNEYHQQRAISQRKQYEELKKAHQNRRTIDVFMEKPVRFLLYIGAIGFILYLYIRMLFEFGL